MTNMEKALLFGSIGAGALSSATSARQNSKNQAQSELDAMVQRQLAALQNKQQTSQNLQDQRQQGWKDQTSQSPLGGEQSFLQKQRLAQVLFPQIANFKPAMPTDPGVAGAYVPPTNILGAFGDSKFLDTFSDQATATSLADRRKLMAGLNPDYEFSSLGNFGLDSSFDGGVNRAQQDATGRRQAYEQTQSDLANQQYALASQPNQQQGQQQEKKGGGFLGGLGKVLKIAAPIAAMAIPGVGPLAAAAIAGGGTALGSKMSGDSWGSALGQGALSAGVGGVGKSLATGGGFNPFNNGGTALNNSMTAASLPVGSFASPQTGVGLPSKGFDLTQFAKGLGDNNASQNNMSSIISGLKPQQFQIPQSQTGFGPPPQSQQQPPMQQPSQPPQQRPQSFQSQLPAGQQNTQFKLPPIPQMPPVQGPPAMQQDPGMLKMLAQIIMGQGTSPSMWELPQLQNAIPSPFVGPALKPMLDRQNVKKFNRGQ